MMRWTLASFSSAQRKQMQHFATFDQQIQVREVDARSNSAFTSTIKLSIFWIVQIRKLFVFIRIAAARLDGTMLLTRD
jgi:hypothetical protein